jgi:hypothetical protein
MPRINDYQMNLIRSIESTNTPLMAFRKICQAFSESHFGNFTGYESVYLLSDGELAIFSAYRRRMHVETKVYSVKKRISGTWNLVRHTEQLLEAWEELQEKVGNRDKVLIVRSKPIVHVSYPTEFMMYCDVGFMGLPDWLAVVANQGFSHELFHNPADLVRLERLDIGYTERPVTQHWLERWRR